MDDVCLTVLTLLLAFLLVLATPRRWGGWRYRAWVVGVVGFAGWVVWVVGG